MTEGDGRSAAQQVSRDARVQARTIKVTLSALANGITVDELWGHAEALEAGLYPAPPLPGEDWP